MIIYLKWDAKQSVREGVKLCVRTVAHIVVKEIVNIRVAIIVMVIASAIATIHVKELQLITKSEYICEYLLFQY